MKNLFKNRIKRNKSLKGMTLLEVIIAMGVMVVLASLLIVSCVGIINHIRIAKNVNHKVNVQAPGIENRNAPGSAYNEDDVISLKYGTKSGSITVDRFSAPDLADDDPEKLNGALDAGNLKYFKLAD